MTLSHEAIDTEALAQARARLAQVRAEWAPLTEALIQAEADLKADTLRFIGPDDAERMAEFLGRVNASVGSE